MDSRFTERTLGLNAANENVLLSIKSSTIAQTPRKLPFSDQTNKSEGLLRSALRPKSFKSEKSQSSQENLTTTKSVTEEASSLSNNDRDDFDFEAFVFPSDKNCFCCGDSRKTDGDVWGERLALSSDFLDLLDSVPLRLEDESCFEPPSPIHVPPPTFLPFEPELEDFPADFDYSLDNLSHKSALELLDLDDDLDSSLEVPECDTSFEADAVDDSILQDW